MEESEAGGGPLIVFAGGGASATLAAIALLRATTWLRLRYRLVLFDEHGRHGRGDAYTAEGVTDTPVRLMSALPDRPAHLLEWARRQGVACSPATRLPCRVYGDYLAQTLSGTVEWAAPYATVDLRTGRVLRTRPEAETVAVEPAGGAPVRAHAAVFATGEPGRGTLPRPWPATHPAEGLPTCPRGALIGPGGQPEHRLFAVGPAREGHSGAALTAIRDHAERLASLMTDTVLRGAPVH